MQYQSFLSENPTNGEGLENPKKTRDDVKNVFESSYGLKHSNLGFGT
jgi:hypothetical protein